MSKLKKRSWHAIYLLVALIACLAWIWQIAEKNDDLWIIWLTAPFFTIAVIWLSITAVTGFFNINPDKVKESREKRRKQKSLR